MPPLCAFDRTFLHKLFILYEFSSFFDGHLHCNFEVMSLQILLKLIAKFHKLITFTTALKKCLSVRQRMCVT